MPTDLDSLRHYGILGMHWGVRKARTGGSEKRSVSTALRKIRDIPETDRQKKIRQGAILVAGILTIVGNVALSYHIQKNSGQIMVAAKKVNAILL